MCAQTGRCGRWWSCRWAGEYRRGHGRLYEALAAGAVVRTGCAGLLAGQLPAGAWLMVGMRWRDISAGRAGGASPGPGPAYAPYLWATAGPASHDPRWPFQSVMRRWNRAQLLVDRCRSTRGGWRGEDACRVTAPGGQVRDLPDQRTGGRGGPGGPRHCSSWPRRLRRAPAGARPGRPAGGGCWSACARDRVFSDGRPSLRRPGGRPRPSCTASASFSPPRDAGAPRTSTDRATPAVTARSRSGPGTACTRGAADRLLRRAGRRAAWPPAGDRGHRDPGGRQPAAERPQPAPRVWLVVLRSTETCPHPRWSRLLADAFLRR